jgi:DNA-binding CsgD family transcriptional regulator/tetratricopeptide (TPR) repeat protein
MLHGREAELARVEALLGGAVEGRSGALIVTGEPGIGKTALLDAAQERGRDRMRVLRTRGFESERELPFAGLYALLAPMLELRDRIPPVQARALGTALAVEPPSPHDPFAVPAAVLSLLGAAAEAGPLLAIVDDLQWLDPASQRAVLFAARRLGAEGVAILLAGRDEEALLPALAGLHRIELGRLDDAAARTILDEVATGPIAEDVAADLVRTAGGNPLALRELPGSLTSAQRAGLEPPLLRLPAGSAVERGFRHRFSALDDDVRRALTLVAAFEVGPASVALDALGRLGLGLPELEVGEEAGLLRIERGEVGFRHPLLRSLTYHASTSSARNAAHRALAEVAENASLRAWHLSAAALGPDEQAAAALEEAAAQARCRGASSEAAAAAQRAAELSPARADAVRRMTAAATDLAEAGRADEALALVDRAAAHDPTAEEETALRILRGRADVRRGALREGRQAIVAEAERVAATDPLLAAFLHVEAGVADITLGSTEGILHNGARAEQLAAGRDEGLHDAGALLQALGLVPVGNGAEAGPLLDRSVHFLLETDPLGAPAEVFAFGAQCALWLGRYELAGRIVSRQLEVLRSASAIGRLPYLLAIRAHLSFRLGRWAQAVAAADEAVGLARQTGQPPQIAFGLSVLAAVEAGRGQAEQALAHAREAHTIVDALGGGPLRIYTAAALGFAALAGERLPEALDHLRLAAATVDGLGGGEPAMMQFDGELIELLARLGHRDEAERRLAWLDQAADATGGVWSKAVAARARGQLAPDDAFAAHFEQALAWHAQDGQPLEEARTRLAFGQRLRRAGERTASREQLGAAGEAFERLGAAGWAERAQTELKASGQTLRKRSMPDSEQLTPSELQVALRVAEGLTNREVAAAIFLSPKTVEHHLSSIYRKLGVRSRTELARRMAEGEPEAEAVPA